jgi:hypothetical protein
MFTNILDDLNINYGTYRKQMKDMVKDKEHLKSLGF